MRRPLISILVAALVLMACGGAVLFQKYHTVSADLTETRAAEKTARQNYAEAFNAIAEIQDSLNAISAGDDAIRLRSQELRAELKLTEPSRQEALESISLLNASIQRAKERIAELETSLNKSGTKVRGLQKMVANLKKTVAEKEENIALLTNQVGALQTQVAGLETTVQQDQQTLAARDESIEQQRKELATIRYIVASKKDLEKEGVIVAKGGVLGLGKTVQLSGSFAANGFTEMDTDHETVVRAEAKKAQVLSPQPPSSYELKVVGNQVELRILDPNEFRKVRHLVIMTA